MSIFTLSQALTDDYKNYVRSFFNIADDRIRAFVEEQLFERDTLWPEALLQLNPSYAEGVTVQELSAQGRLHPSPGGRCRCRGLLAGALLCPDHRRRRARP